MGDENFGGVWYAFSMKRRMKKILNYILISSLTAGIVGYMAENHEMVVQATSAAIADVKNQITQTQNQIEDINEKIEGYEDELALAEELIADLNAEIINTMTSIGMKEDEIAAKEVELVDKQGEIDVTEQEYESAKLQEEQQYTAMIKRVRDMYEMGSVDYMSFFLAGEGLSGVLNRMDFVEEIYEYDRLKLTEYETTRELVLALWNQLEQEKTQLEADKVSLENDRAALEAQKVNLDGMLAKKKQESANFEAEIEKAKQEAAVAKKLLQQEQKKLQQLQAQQKQSQKGNTAAANGKYTSTSYTSTIEDANGSDMGKKVAKYACQYIGNPYVYGGTSLTNGADCSGFTYRVYQDFGYSLPRTSTEQRSAGKGVDYSDAEPGDLICYSGHVGIYIGGGKIVHASTEKTGIKVSNATYRSILSVRRIL